MSAYTSRLHSISQPTVTPETRLNPGGDGVPPFATVKLTEATYMTIYTPEEAYALRDAFQQAGDGLSGVTQ